jgi:hypothetical protein
MLMSFRNLVLLSAALCATAAFAAEQRRVEVPFAFVAKNHAYRAGAYTISIDDTRSFVTLSQIGKWSQPLTWIVTPGDTDPSHPKVSLTFDVTETGHVLRTIQYEQMITPILDKNLKQMVERTASLGE